MQRHSNNDTNSKIYFLNYNTYCKRKLFNILNWNLNSGKQKSLDVTGFEPGSPAWQSGIITTAPFLLRCSLGKILFVKDVLAHVLFM